MVGGLDLMNDEALDTMVKQVIFEIVPFKKKYFKMKLIKRQTNKLQKGNFLLLFIIYFSLFFSCKKLKFCPGDPETGIQNPMLLIELIDKTTNFNILFLENILSITLKNENGTNISSQNISNGLITFEIFEDEILEHKAFANKQSKTYFLCLVDSTTIDIDTLELKYKFDLYEICDGNQLPYFESFDLIYNDSLYENIAKNGKSDLILLPLFK